MGFYIFILLVLMPVVEIALLIEIGSIIGTLETILLIVITAVLGTFLLRRQGTSVLQRTQQSLNAGEMPVSEVFEGVCLLGAGVLLLTPGFVTDGVGFLLLIPSMRLMLGRWLLERLLARGSINPMDMAAGGRFGGAEPAPDNGTDVLEGDFHEVPDGKSDPS